MAQLTYFYVFIGDVQIPLSHYTYRIIKKIQLTASPLRQSNYN